MHTDVNTSGNPGSGSCSNRVKEIMSFLDIHSNTYGTIDKYYILWQVNLKNYIFKDGVLFIYTEYDDYIHNNWLLFDINQTDSLLASYREFKNILKMFDKPIYIGNVSTEFLRLAKKQGSGYVWKS